MKTPSQRRKTMASPFAWLQRMMLLSLLQKGQKCTLWMRGMSRHWSISTPVRSTWPRSRRMSSGPEFRA